LPPVLTGGFLISQLRALAKIEYLAKALFQIYSLTSS